MNISTLFFIAFFISTNVSIKFSIDINISYGIINLVRFIDNKIKTKGGI